MRISHTIAWVNATHGFTVLKQPLLFTKTQRYTLNILGLQSFIFTAEVVVFTLVDIGISSRDSVTIDVAWLAGEAPHIEFVRMADE